MTREETKKLLPAITHFANGGSLWCYDEIKKEWFTLNDNELNWDITNKACYIIEDKHFEARKGYALGEDIEYLNDHDKWITDVPEWQENLEYRIKPKKPIYDYQFTFRRDEQWYISIGRWQGIKEAIHFIVGSDIAIFEPSKRIRQ